MVVSDLIITGLAILVRRPNEPVWFHISNQVMLSAPGGTIGICGQVAVMAAAEHSEAATTLALFSLFTGLGSAFGRTIATGIYTVYMPKSLEKHLPADAKPWAKIICGSLSQQLSYPMGSAVRQAIIRAYSDFMRHACIAALALVPLTLLWVAMWDNINVNKNRGVKRNAV